MSLKLDPSDVNDVIAALDDIAFKRYVILEDFHYLPIETQKDFAVALKAFHEVSHLPLLSLVFGLKKIDSSYMTAI